MSNVEVHEETVEEEEAEVDIPLPEVEEQPSENLNTGEVVREELERLGVDSDLLGVIEQT